MPESDRAELVGFLAANPKAGDLIPEAGGVRKIRWALPGRGKSGGARVIYYYHNESIPVFLWPLMAKAKRLISQGRNESQWQGWCLNLSGAIRKGTGKDEKDCREVPRETGSERGRPDY